MLLRIFKGMRRTTTPKVKHSQSIHETVLGYEVGVQRCGERVGDKLAYFSFEEESLKLGMVSNVKSENYFHSGIAEICSL